jgi:hypothetical protein
MTSESPTADPTITNPKPATIPSKKGIVLEVPKIALLAARASGAGPGEPNNRAVAPIRTSSESTNDESF